MLVTLEELRFNCRVGASTAFDARFAQLCEAAEDWVERTTGRTIAEHTDRNGGKVPPMLREAALMYATYAFQHPSGETRENTAPFNAYSKLKPFIKL